MLSRRHAPAHARVLGAAPLVTQFSLPAATLVQTAATTKKPPSSVAVTSQVLKAALTRVDAAQGSSFSIPGFDGAAVRNDLLASIASGKADSKGMLKQFFAASAAIGCTAAGGAALAPLCAQGGRIVADAVAGFQVRPSGAVATEESQRFSATMDADWAMLKQQKEGMYYGLAAKLNGDGVAMKEMQAVLDEFFPFESPGAPRGRMTPGAAGGFLLPFIAWGCWVGNLYSDGCDAVEYEADWSIQPPPKSGWPQACLGKFLQVVLAAYGINLSYQVTKVIEENDKSPRWDAPSQAANLLALYQDEKMMLWPALQIEMERRITNVLVKAAVRANDKFLDSLDDLADLIEKRDGCSGPACRKRALEQAVKYSQLVADKGIDAALAEIEQAPPAGPLDEGSKRSYLWPAAVTVALAYLAYKNRRKFLKRSR